MHPEQLFHMRLFLDWSSKKMMKRGLSKLLSGSLVSEGLGIEHEFVENYGRSIFFFELRKREMLSRL